MRINVPRLRSTSDQMITQIKIRRNSRIFIVSVRLSVSKLSLLTNINFYYWDPHISLANSNAILKPCTVNSGCSRTDGVDSKYKPNYSFESRTLTIQFYASMLKKTSCN